MNKAVFAFFAVICGPLLAQPVTVVAFGDSLTQGFGLAQGQGFVPQLQRWLDGQGAEVTLVNAGVSGDTTAGGLARIDWTLTPEVDAMIVALGGNDLLRGLAPELVEQNLNGILQATTRAGVDVLLVGMQAPGNYGPDYKQAFDAVYPGLAAQYDVVFHPGFFDGLPSDDPSQLQQYFQPDGIHPNADGVARIVEGLGPSVLHLIDRATE